MGMSVNNNASILLALQSLNQTTQNLQSTETDVSSGLAINAPQDDPSIWAIAQGQQQQVSALSAVSASLNRASSIADVASNAGQSISNLLNQIKTTVLSATDVTLNTSARASLNTNYQALLNQITEVIQNASFDGANLIDGSTPSLQFMTNGDASQFITLMGQDLALGGPLLTVSPTSSINTATNAQAVLAQVNSSITTVNDALSELGTQSDQITNHLTFVGQLSDSLNTGIGNLIDADMAADSARLQALQVQQQLSVQAINVANNAPQTILSLFRSGAGG
jgi:flagellin